MQKSKKVWTTHDHASRMMWWWPKCRRLLDADANKSAATCWITESEWSEIVIQANYIVFACRWKKSRLLPSFMPGTTTQTTTLKTCDTRVTRNGSLNFARKVWAPFNVDMLSFELYFWDDGWWTDVDGDTSFHNNGIFKFSLNFDINVIQRLNHLWSDRYQL